MPKRARPESRVRFRQDESPVPRYRLLTSATPEARSPCQQVGRPRPPSFAPDLAFPRRIETGTGFRLDGALDGPNSCTGVACKGNARCSRPVRFLRRLNERALSDLALIHGILRLIQERASVLRVGVGSFPRPGNGTKDRLSTSDPCRTASASACCPRRPSLRKRHRLRRSEIALGSPVILHRKTPWK